MAIPLSDMLYGPLIYYTNTIMIEFVAGMILCILFMNDRLNATMGWIFVILGLIGFAGIMFHIPDMPQLRFLYFGVPAWLLVAGAVSIEAERKKKALLAPTAGIRRIADKALMELGAASYALYLSHIFTLGALRFVWPKVTSFDSVAANFTGFMIVAFILCIPVAIAVHHLVELPASAALKRLVSTIQAQAFKRSS